MLEWFTTLSTSTEGRMFALVISILIVVYIIGHVAKNARHKKLEKEKNRIRLEELSLGAESLFFHVPYHEKETHAQ